MSKMRVAVMLSFLAMASPAHAELLEHSYLGEVNNIFLQNPPNPAISDLAGEIMTVRYSYDSTAPDDEPGDTSTGSYALTPGNSALEATTTAGPTASS